MGIFKFYVVGILENRVVRENEKHDYQKGNRVLGLKMIGFEYLSKNLKMKIRKNENKFGLLKNEYVVVVEFSISLVVSKFEKS